MHTRAVRLRLIYSLKTLAHFRPKVMVDFLHSVATSWKGGREKRPQQETQDQGRCEPSSFAGFCLLAALPALKAAADNPEGSFTSAAAKAARSRAAEAAPELAALELAASELAAPALAAPGLAAPALAAPAVWAEEEDSAIGLYGCTKLITTVAVGGLRRCCPANRLPVLSSKAWPSGSISSLWALKKSTPNIGKATSAKRNFQEKS